MIRPTTTFSLKHCITLTRLLFFAKFPFECFCVHSGLFVGKEGPMIHSGAIVGAGLPQVHTAQ